jgi:drug/metabolite transporter superfamily protein YnfA
MTRPMTGPTAEPFSGASSFCGLALVLFAISLSTAGQSLAGSWSVAYAAYGGRRVRWSVFYRSSIWRKRH